jgi:hypothetical protein
VIHTQFADGRKVDHKIMLGYPAPTFKGKSVPFSLMEEIEIVRRFYPTVMSWEEIDLEKALEEIRRGSEQKTAPRICIPVRIQKEGRWTPVDLLDPQETSAKDFVEWVSEQPETQGASIPWDSFDLGRSDVRLGVVKQFFNVLDFGEKEP